MSTKYCKQCRQRLDYCKCPTENLQQRGKYMCAWAGCNNQGVISESTNGGDFYCRTHAREVIGWYS